MALRWAVDAKADLRAIADFSKSQGREPTKIKAEIEAIKVKANWISTRGEAGSPIVDAPPHRLTYVLKFRYVIYYQILGPRTIHILAVKHTKEERLTKEQLNARV